MEVSTGLASTVEDTVCLTKRGDEAVVKWGLVLERDGFLHPAGEGEELWMPGGASLLGS
jgi:hypothetical protein